MCVGANKSEKAGRRDKRAGMAGMRLAVYKEGSQVILHLLER